MALPTMPKDIQDNLGEIKNDPKGKLLIRNLIYAVIGLSIAVSVLFWQLQKSNDKGSTNYKNQLADKDKQLLDKDKQLAQKDLLIFYWQGAFHVKDSQYEDCGKKLYTRSIQTDVSVDKSSVLTKTIKTLSKGTK